MLKIVEFYIFRLQLNYTINALTEQPIQATRSFSFVELNAKNLMRSPVFVCTLFVPVNKRLHFISRLKANRPVRKLTVFENYHIWN